MRWRYAELSAAPTFNRTCDATHDTPLRGYASPSEHQAKMKRQDRHAVLSCEPMYTTGMRPDMRHDLCEVTQRKCEL